MGELAVLTPPPPAPAAALVPAHNLLRSHRFRSGSRTADDDGCVVRPAIVPAFTSQDRHGDLKTAVIFNDLLSVIFKWSNLYKEESTGAEGLSGEL